jgi:hypothetical protein
MWGKDDLHEVSFSKDFWQHTVSPVHAPPVFRRCLFLNVVVVAKRPLMMLWDCKNFGWEIQQHSSHSVSGAGKLAICC